MKEKNLDKIKVGCLGKIKTTEEVIARINTLKEELRIYLEDIDKIETDEFFTGVVFATFNTNREYLNYLDFFPKSFFAKLVSFVKYYSVFHLCGCCFSENYKKVLKKKRTFVVLRAPEPQDVIWENLEFSDYQRLKRSIFVYFITFFLLLISFGIVLGLNHLQYKSKDFDNSAVKFGLSILITITITVINSIILHFLNSLSQ
jgi:hypothetical protein